jgi:magnesium transporter
MSKKRIKFPPSKKGIPHGVPVYTGSIQDLNTLITVITYSKNISCQTRNMTTDEFLIWQPEPDSIHWINVTGVSNAKNIGQICRKFDIHYLYQEDIMNIYQRPKVDEDDNYIYATFKSLNWDTSKSLVTEEQYSTILLNNIVISFEETVGDNFDILRDKLHLDNSFYSVRGADYLFYKLLDITVDHYFDVVEKIGDQLETLEDQLLAKARPAHLSLIQETKKDLIQTRKNVVPLRELLSRLMSSDHKTIDPKTRKYFGDVQDHVIQVIDITETYLEINLSLKDIYLNSLSHDMNHVIKILTIISTFFIPLTFLVGVYGMNFDNMPELRWPHGYYYIWGLMLFIVVSLSIYFRKKGWF